MAETIIKSSIHRGDIVWVDFSNFNGNLQNGVRPALILQNDKGNIYSPTVILCTLTTKMKKLNQPTHILATKENTGLPKDSIIQLENIQTVNKFQIVSIIGKINNKVLSKVDDAIRLSLALA